MTRGMFWLRDHAKTWLNWARFHERYAMPFGRTQDETEASIETARRIGFGDVRTLDDLICASHAMLAHPAFRDADP